MITGIKYLCMCVMSVCVCVCAFIKLHVIAQYGPAILHSHYMPCACVLFILTDRAFRPYPVVQHVVANPVRGLLDRKM